MARNAPSASATEPARQTARTPSSKIVSIAAPIVSVTLVILRHTAGVEVTSPGGGESRRRPAYGAEQSIASLKSGVPDV